MVSHARPFYYLENFCYALAWLKGRYTDLMRAEELAFVDAMERLPQQSAALLVRMIMRRGEFFRTSKLHYAEIGSTESAAESLVELAWVDPRPPLSLQQLCALLRRDELQVAFSLRRPPRRLTSKRSPQQLPLDFSEDESRTLERWWRDAPDQVLHVRVTGVCERLRLMFFGNFHQDWSAFVLSDLGIQRYETVPLDGRARAFQTREQIDHFESLYRLRELVHAEAPAEAVLAGMPPSLPNCDWIEAQRSRLLFHIGQQSERARDLPRAIHAYRSCALAEARVRTIRVLERMGHADEASALLTASEASSASELERQHAARIRPRLMRRLGLQAPRPTIERGWSSFELELAAPDPPCAVERVVRDHLQSEDSPVFYVESGLINSLFGLLFWDAIFAPVSGAFFHPFQAAPADLHEPDFQARRARELDACFAQLESGDYRATILDHFERKAGVASPFVAWGLVSRELLTLALTCVPAAHLRELFGRLLCDLRANRAGLPDLIQLWPREQRYRMVEVKGPGDRLQDNQVRWLTFCATKGIPAEVCSVTWAS